MADKKKKNDTAMETAPLVVNDPMTPDAPPMQNSLQTQQQQQQQQQQPQQQQQQNRQQNATSTPAASPSPPPPPPPPPPTTKMSPIAAAAAASASTASSPSLSPRRSPVTPSSRRPPPPPSPRATSSVHSDKSASPLTAVTAAAIAASGAAAVSGDELPSNVNSIAQLSSLPKECWTGSTKDIRPLRHVDEWGRVSHYALNPTFYSVYAILIVELLERFAFYGINYTQTSYLTGAYNANWNADMDAVWASTYVSISVAVAYTAPFLGAHLADALLGDYMTILTGCLVCYLPGLFLIAATTVPGLIVSYRPVPGSRYEEQETTTVLSTSTGDGGGVGTQGHFNRSVVAFALLFLWPVGTGIVKSAVNVFGARQFHPLLQSAQIESYYVNFYTSINVGALLGGIMVPLLAQVNVTAAYLLPAAMLAIGVVVFTSHQKRYVKTKPNNNNNKNKLAAVFGTKRNKKKGCLGRIVSLFKKKKRVATRPAVIMRQGSSVGSSANKMGLMVIVQISVLVVPFNIAYSQMSTTFIVQGTVMKKAFFGLIDAACMNNADAVAVLYFGYIIGSKLYPALAERGLRIPTSYKFAMGSLLGVLAIGWALMVESMIHSSFHATGEPVSILWQAPSYILIGAGEIWAVSSAYEAVFNASAPEKKVLASAINLFFNGSVPNVICIFLYNVCAPWFRNSHGTTNITHLGDYATANVANYFWVLFIISMGGVIANLLPATRQFMQNVEDKAAESIKTPKTPVRPPTAERRRAASAAARLGEEESESDEDEEVEDEEAQLLRMHRHQLYLKYGSGPVLHKAGSMRAGVSSIYNKNKKETSKVRRKQLERLYKSDFSLLPSSAAASPAQLVPRDGGVGVIGGGGTGAPILAPGTFLMPRQQQPQQKPPSGPGRHLEKQSSM